MNASNCEKISPLLSLYMDNMLSEKENDSVREHIKTCAACREEYEFMKTLASSTKDLPMPELPKDFHENLMAKVRETKQEETKRVTFTFGPGFRRTVASFAAAAAVVAVSVVSLQNLDSGNVSVNPDTYVEMATPKDAEEIVTPVTPEQHENKPTVNPVTPEKPAREEVSGTPLAPQTAEENPAPLPASDVPMVASLDDETDGGGAAAFSGRMIQHQMVTVYVKEQEQNTAKEILSAYPEHEAGYFVEEGLREVIRTLTERVACHTEGMTEDGQDSGYITLVAE